MKTQTGTPARIAAVTARLARRDRRIVALYAVGSVAVVGAMEAVALGSGMVVRLGVTPLLLRAGAYVALTTILWALLLRGNRRLVHHLLHESLRHYEAMLQAYVDALGLKDAYTAAHGRRVAAVAAELARAMGLPEARVERTAQAGLLHDLGKLAVPDAVLGKPTSLRRQELAQMWQHPRRGADILARIPALAPLAPAVRHHHEHLDGTGYPDGLRGEAIPLEARIVAVADTLDALTSRRPYRAPRPLSEAVHTLRALAGITFDAGVVRVLEDERLLARLAALLEIHEAPRAGATEGPTPPRFALEES